MNINTPLPSGNTTRSTALSSLCLLAAAGASLGVTGCSQADGLPTRDLGATPARLTDAPDESGGAGEGTDVIHDGIVDPFIIGHWVGQAENSFASAGPLGERPTYVFPSGSTDITMDLDSFPGGQIVFGAGTPPAPQRGVAFPPGFNHFYAALSNRDATFPALPPIEGFAYRLDEGIYRLADNDTGAAAGVLAVSYLANAPFEPWCALQPALPEGDGDFNCIGSVGLTGGDPLTGEPCISSLPNGTEEPVDCNLATLCAPGGVCDCREGGCGLDDYRYHQLWLIREGDELIGNFVGAVFDHGTPGRFLPIGSVRFRRQSP